MRNKDGYFWWTFVTVVPIVNMAAMPALWNLLRIPYEEMKVMKRLIMHEEI